MPELEVGTDRLHFIDEGTGPPVVMIHGSCGGAGQWKSLSAGLQDEGYRSIRVDLLGAGRSSAWPGDRVWRQGSDTPGFNALLDRIGAPVHLVLHSGAGPFSFPFMQERHGELLSLTMFEPVYFALLHEAGDPLFAEPREMARGYRRRWEDGDREGALEFFVDTWSREAGTWASLPDRMKAMMRPYAARLYHEWEEMPQPAPLRADLEQLSVPTLLLKGTRTVPSVHALLEIAVGAIPGSRLVAIEGAGHMAPFTHALDALPHVLQHIQSATG